MMNRLKEAIARSALGGIERSEDGVCLRRYCFPADFPGFAGHFPGHPVLPAVVQLLTAEHLVEAAQGRPLALGAVEGAKFLREIGPGQEVEVSVRARLAKGRPAHDCRLSVAEGLAASFLLLPAEEPA